TGGYSKHSPQDKDGVAKTLYEYMTGQGNYRTHDLAAVCLRRRIGIRLSIELALARHRGEGATVPDGFRYIRSSATSPPPV
ncbi:MAG: hypothetical protein K2K59_05140, partial [Muribaculaceae bacterium]|nr:hypothetical protein [Muribaculaceae bacterium]